VRARHNPDRSFWRAAACPRQGFGDMFRLKPIISPTEKEAVKAEQFEPNKRSLVGETGKGPGKGSARSSCSNIQTTGNGCGHPGRSKAFCRDGVVFQPDLRRPHGAGTWGGPCRTSGF
jgi:hypothetical protein